MKKITLKVNKEHNKKVEQFLLALRQWKKDSLSGKYVMFFGKKDKKDNE
jgi:hypothetical protein